MPDCKPNIFVRESMLCRIMDRATDLCKAGATVFFTVVVLLAACDVDLPLPKFPDWVVDWVMGTVVGLFPWLLTSYRG
jgi:hypothetical protein